MKFKSRFAQKFIAILLVLTFVLPQVIFNASPNLPYIQASTQMRGLWVTTAYNLDWPSRRDLTPTQIQAEIDDILNRAAAQGINAVFVQVRPVADSFFPSEIFPWSHLLTGTQGVAPANDFDPLAYWIQQAHALGIQVHAWLNPFRVTFPNQDITNPRYLAPNHPARLDPSLVVAYGRSLFFDPGNPAARQLVVDGAAEILRNYNIDGIHLDDYFYPSRNFPDQATFARYGGGMNLHDWRRENVNALVRDLQSITHEIRPNASFGISPFAIWRNDDRDPKGSATRGMESYYSQYADTRRWVEEGWVDYIAPQIYWVEGNAAACYEVVLSWWEDVVRGTDVRLYIGLAPYREVNRETDPRFANWRQGDIVRQLERNARSNVVSGSIFFREQFMRSAVGDAIGRFYANNLPGQVPTRRQPGSGAPNIVIPPLPNPQPTIPPPIQPDATPPNRPPLLILPPIPTPPRPAPPTITMDRLMVAQPSGASRQMTDAAGFWFYGSGVPNVPVYVNGQLIEDRTEEGFFSIFLPLERGANNFAFTQAGQTTVNRTVVNSAPTPAQPPTPMAQATVVNPFPATREMAQAGETITLRATAPGGATVTATIGGQTITLTQTNASITATAANILPAQFTGSFTLNAPLSADFQGNGVVEIGRPVYTMTWNGQTQTVTAPGSISQLTPYAPYFMEITNSSAWVFPQAGTTGGSGWALINGQQDRVTAITGDWTRLASGGWVQNEHIRTFENRDIASYSGNRTIFGQGQYTQGRYADTITWETPVFPAIQGAFDGEQLIVTFGMQNTVPPLDYTLASTMFSDITLGTHNGAPAYFMTLREGENLEGFYVAYQNGNAELHLRRRRPLTPGNYPFAGFTFVIDAGHGGTDPGAVGPMGPVMSEAVLVRAQSDLLVPMLQDLGATVVTIGDNDTFYTLQERVDITRGAKPDMFLSLHTNATGEATNATNIRGFTVWFRNENSRPAANTFLDVLHDINPGTNRSRQVNQANFFVLRPMWAPSILLEASFTNNIHDFSWMANPARQEEYARGIVNALLAYFR